MAMGRSDRTLWAWLQCLSALAAAALALALGLAWQMWPDFCCEVLELQAQRQTQRCPDVGTDIPGDLVKHGYSLLRNALDAESSRRLLAFAQTLSWADYFSGYRVPQDTGRLFEIAPGLWPMLQRLVKEIQAKSNITVAAPDVPLQGTWKHLEFLTADGADPAHSVGFQWHQDVEAYYVSQQSYEYLNMYLFLEKEDPENAGISVMSMAHLGERAPGLFQRLLGGAATVWEEGKGKRQLGRSHARWDRFWLQDFRVEDLGCTPAARAGDLVIMRGDTPHRTQWPLRGRRTALSVRIARRDGFSLEELYSGGMVKYARLWRNKGMFAGLAMGKEFGEAFERQKADWPRAPLAMRLRARWHLARISAGFHYRQLLSFVRCRSGGLLGEPLCPVAYY